MTFEDFVSKYPLRLNEQQREAVKTINGPVLLLSAPGSGKTTVVVARLGYMIACGIDPSDILTMTYTVASCNDMQSRFKSMFGEELAEKVEFKTINAVCVQILNRYAYLTGKTVYDVITEEDRSGYIKLAVRNLFKIYPTESDIRDVGSSITKAKNLLMSKRDIETEAWEVDRFPEIFNEYNRLMKEDRKMDFDDQLVSAYKILTTVPAILDWIREKVKYLMVDEAQDTSKVQHYIIKLIVEKSRNVCEVADDDQSLYSWRGAYPQALMEFQQLYPDGKVLFMESNFRCDAFIVDCADRFIQSNTIRYRKHIKAEREYQYPVQTKRFAKRDEQYEYLVETLKDIKNETAILYRYNESAISIIDRLERAGVRYNTRQLDMSFFSHMIVSDISAAIKLAFDESDIDSFLRIYYKVGFYIRKEFAEEVCKRVKDKKSRTVFQAIEDLSGHSISVKKDNDKMHENFMKLTTVNGAAAVDVILNEMGYADFLTAASLSDRKSGILKTLGAKTESSIELVERLAELQKIIASKEKDDTAKVTLTSMHSSKGLEWDSCIIVDAYDGYFPEKIIKNYKNAKLDEISLYEEERRAYYVASTRAKNHLTIFTYDFAKCTFTNQFLGLERVAIPKEYLAKTPAYNISKPAVEEKPVKEIDPEEYEAFAKKLCPGAKIMHSKFGEGHVVATEGKSVMINMSGSVKIFAIKTLFEEDLLCFL